MKILEFYFFLQSLQIYILCLIFSLAFSDKKVNLEDIERDNLRSEVEVGKKSPESFRAEETKYSLKPEVNQHQYHVQTNQPQELSNQVRDYSDLKSYKELKYTVIKHLSICI